MVRAIGMDVRRDFSQVAIAHAGVVRSAGRIEMTPRAFGVLAGSVAPTDALALEVPATEIARILEPHVARVVANLNRTYRPQARRPAAERDRRRPCRLVRGRARSHVKRLGRF